MKPSHCLACLWMIIAVAGVAMTPACSWIGDASTPSPPATPLRALEARSPFGMVATGSPEATEVGVAVLEAGGNAIDAAVAAAMALGVSDPGDSGLGGMTHIVVHLADGTAAAIDGSPRVPLGVDLARLGALDEAEQTWGMEWVAVPSTPAVLAHACERWGTWSLAELIAPAIRLAEEGYGITPFQQTAIRWYWDEIRRSPYLPLVILKNGVDVPGLSDRFCRPDLARTLRRFAGGGVREFYRGRIADEIEAHMIAAGGFLRKSDLAMFTIRETEPLRGSYRDTEIVTIPPPGSGGAVIEALNILGTFPQELIREDSADRLHVLAEAFHIAFADYHRFNRDPNQPLQHRDLSYLSGSFAADRAAMISLDRALTAEDLATRRPVRDAGRQTTHVAVADRYGNTASLTGTLSRFYGCKYVTPGLGFPYNDLLEVGAYSPTMLRPRGVIPTDMSPTIVLRDGELLLALGSGGSSGIPAIVAFVISNVVDREMSLGDAIVAPRIIWGGKAPPHVCVEISGPVTAEHVAELERRGHQDIYRAPRPASLKTLVYLGSVNATHFDNRTRVFSGVGDPRRCGAALGPRL